MRDVVLDLDVEGQRVDDRLRRRVLHRQEGLDGLDLRVVADVGQRLALGRQTAARHPTGVLVLLV